MNLFISNSKPQNNRFIFNTVLMCLFLFLVYNLYILINPPQITLFDNQFKDNISTVQRYLYDYSKSPFVIVGSSLAATLNNEILLKNGTYNLSFKGSGPMTGLSLIAKGNLRPNAVLIEINSILLSPNDEFIQKVTSPIPFRIKRLLPSLRDEYQPVNLFINILLNLSNSSRALNVFDQGRFKKAFQIKKQTYGELPDQTILKKKIDELSSLIVQLGENGVKLIFFEMPIHKELRNSLRMKTIRSVVEKKFPKEKYSWIEGLSIFEQETTDGIHITSEAAIKVSDHLMAKLKAI